MSVPIKQLSVNFPFVFPVDKLHPSRRNLGPGASQGQPGPASPRGGVKVALAGVGSTHEDLPSGACISILYNFALHKCKGIEEENFFPWQVNYLTSHRSRA